MSADWFCKIGEKKVGPLNGHQLKNIVAKGQLKPEHLVRRGSEGPWVPAGRIKGLFPEGAAGNARPQGKKPPATAKPLPTAAAKPPTAKAAPLPAAEAPQPAADIPSELTLGGHHKHHVQMNVDSLNIETAPVPISHRKVKTGLKALKKNEQKKLNVILLSVIGGGLTFGVIAFVYGIASGKLFPHEEPKQTAEIGIAGDSGKGADSAKKVEKEPSDKKPAADKAPDHWNQPLEPAQVGDVVVNVLRPSRGAPPDGAKTEETYVLTVPVTLALKAKNAKDVELTSWADDSLKEKVSLTDEQNKKYKLLDQVGGKGKSITATRMTVQLVFEAPTSKKPKLKLALPPAAFRGSGPMIGYEINASDFRSEAAKPAEGEKAEKTEKAEKAEKPAKTGDGESAESTPKGDKKSAKAKPAEGDSSDDAAAAAKARKKPGKAKPAEAKADDGEVMDPPTNN